MSKFVGSSTYFQDDWSDEELSNIISNALDMALELAKQHENIYYDIFPDGQAGDIVFATEPFEQWEAEEWLEEKYQTSDEDEFPSHRHVFLEDPPLRVEEIFNCDTCTRIYDSVEKLEKGDIAVFRMSRVDDPSFVKELTDRGVWVLLVSDEKSWHLQEQLRTLKVTYIDSVPSNQEQKEVAQILGLI